MLKCIKLGEFQEKTIAIGNEWFVAERYTGIAFDVSSDTLMGIVRNHLPQQYKFSRKQIGINGSKSFITTPEVCRVINMTFETFLLKGIIIYKIKPGKHRKQSIWPLTRVYL